jgi:hypothetical protein
VRINKNQASLSSPQLEPSVASNPTNPLQLVAGFADYVADAEPGTSRSTDGGQTWSVPAGGAILPNPPGFSWGRRDAASQLAGGDSAVAWALGDTVYRSTLGFHDNASPPSNDCSGGGFYVYRSDDGGDTWTLPAHGPVAANTHPVFRDKEYIAADANPSSRFAGNVYAVWSDDNYSGCPQQFSVNFVRRDIVFSASSDDGASWSTPTILGTGCLEAAVPAVAANGDLYVAWNDCNQGVREIVRKSNDGGASFQPAVAAASGLANPPNPLVGSKFHVNGPFPAIATDPTNPMNVYVTWSSNNGASQTDVFLSRSLDGGATWSSTPVRVNDDAIGNPRDQFFPWIAVRADGSVLVTWGDDRLDLMNAGGKLYDLFAAESLDNGASFEPNVRVTANSSNPDLDGFGGTFLGDYWGLSASGFPVWDDEQSGNQDIFGAPLPTVTPIVCSALPVAGCRKPIAAGASTIQLKANANPNKKGLTWKWTKGAATTLADFGDPTAVTDYVVCAYDETAGTTSLVMNAAAPAGSNWVPTSAGFKFASHTLTPNGLKQIILQQGVAGKAKITVSGKGANLGLPTLPLKQDPGIVVQLQNSAGVCWEADYSTPAKPNNSASFKDKSD